MKHTLFIFALITASIQTFAQSPRIKLNQITKDSVVGSVLISSPTDSGMVYSRDLFISYGADTVLILGGDTLAATSGIISSVLSDGVTINGNGTLGSELTADTSVLATLRALSDSLALVISSVTADGVTITGDGTVGSPLKVDTATVIATKGDLDLYYLDSNPDGYTSNTGTVTSVAATAGTGISVSGSPITTSGTLTITNTAPDQTVSIAGGGINAVSGTYPSFTVTGTEVDGSVTNEGSLTVGAGGANDAVISSNTSGSSDVTISGGTNVTVTESGQTITISSTGGGGSYNNISETADTVYISDYLDVDTATLYVDGTNNRVGIGTSSPAHTLHIDRSVSNTTRALLIGDSAFYSSNRSIVDISGTHEMNNYGAGLYYTPTIQNTDAGTEVYGYFAYPNINLQQNLTNYSNFLSLQRVYTNGYTLDNLVNAFYRNDFFSSTGTVTNSTTVDVKTPFIASGAIKPTNQYGFRIRNQGVSGMTTSYGLYIDNQTGATNSYSAIFNGGNVGIGTASPSQKLTLSGPLSRMDFALRDVGSISTQNIFVYDQNSYDNDLDTVDARFAFYLANPNSPNFTGSNTDGPYFFMRGNGSAAERGYIAFIAGNVSNPTGYDGRIDFQTGTGVDMTIEADGDVYFTNDISAADVVDRSDVRLKENIYEYQNGLNDIMQLNPVYFNLIDNNRKRLGFIAQDVREVIPEAVTGEEDKEFLGISYSSFSAALTKAIQEQQSIIEYQSTEIETLKTLITDLSNRLQILENN